MKPDVHIPISGGVAFEDGDDYGRVLVFGRDTGGLYSLMEYAVAGRPRRECHEEPGYGVHRHDDIEETFLVRSGCLQFLLDEQVIGLGPGDFVRVLPGTRHGFANLSTETVHLLVTFYPGGFEELFIRHRSDQEPPLSPIRFVEDAVRLFNSAFEDHPHVGHKVIP